MSYALLLLQHNIALKEAKDYGDVSIQALHLQAKSLFGIGYPWSGDAHRIVAAKEQA